MKKKSLLEWARIFACEGKIAIYDTQRLYNRMSQQAKAEGLWDSVETKSRNNQHFRVFAEELARELAEKSLPLPKRPQDKMRPWTISYALENPDGHPKKLFHRENLKRFVLQQRKHEKVACALLDNLEQYPDLQPAFENYVGFTYNPMYESSALYAKELNGKTNEELESMMMDYEKSGSIVPILRARVRQLIDQVIEVIPDWVITNPSYLEAGPIHDALVQLKEGSQKHWRKRMATPNAAFNRQALAVFLEGETNFMDSVEKYEQFQNLLIEIVTTYAER